MINRPVGAHTRLSSPGLRGERSHAHLRRELVGLLLIGLGLFLIAGAQPTPRPIVAFMAGLLRFIVGTVGLWVTVACLFVAGVMALAWRRPSFEAHGTIGAVLIGLCILGSAQLGVAQSGVVGRFFSEEPAGLLGVMLAELLKASVGKWLGYTLLAGCGIVGLALALEMTPAALAARAGVLLFQLPKMALRLLLRRRAPELARALPRERMTPAATASIQFSPRWRARPRLPSEIEAQTAQPHPESRAQPELTQQPQLVGYVPPALSFLSESEGAKLNRRDERDNIGILEQTLHSFGIEAKVVEIERGPRVTRYEVQPPAGVRVSKITSLADDLALALAALDVRVEAPVPGKGVIGIEVPNKDVVYVDLKDILRSEGWTESSSKLAFALGKDISGHSVVADLAKMPHLLIAGATNSGKSVCLSSLIVSLLFRASPQELKFLMIDPKRVELSLFEGIPHLVAAVAHDARQAAGLLRWAIMEMERRYSLFSERAVRNIYGYNELAQSPAQAGEPVPPSGMPLRGAGSVAGLSASSQADEPGIEPLYFLVIVIDELADLMMQAPTEFEMSICRIAQLARATGIHLVVATQRPSVNVITGTIKANISSRIAFAVASQADSRVILDINGAERLVGSGDMLFLPMDATKPTRIQGAYVSEQDIARIVEHLRAQGQPDYKAQPLSLDKKLGREGEEDEITDELFQKALDFILSTNYASTSMLQRKMRIGYTRAARLIDMMEERGYVGPSEGSRPREVYSTPLERGERLRRKAGDGAS
jgi:S-DNA-T family DNA segregation ATPase FtsK/SpoIIIE